jgi:hypothetical protein
MESGPWPVLSGIAGRAKSAVIGESGFQRRRVRRSEKEHRTIGDRVAKSEAATQDSLVCRIYREAVLGLSPGVLTPGMTPLSDRPHKEHGGVHNGDRSHVAIGVS